MLTAQQQTEAAVWVAQFASASAALQESAGMAAAMAYDGVDWYDDVAVFAAAMAASSTSSASSQMAAGLAAQYAANMSALLKGSRVSVVPLDMPPLRNGADMREVYTRPAKVFRREVSLSKTRDEALAAAIQRAQKLAATDARLSEREAARQEFARLGVREFRRVLRPELAREGSCGLCIAASDRVYSTAVLMPIHPGCHCVPAPIVDGVDPGRSLNAEDLERLYREAGSTVAWRLRQTRYRVNEHGEFGPVLTVEGQHFRGPSDLNT